MIVCSCNIISSNEIADTVRDLLGSDPWRLIVPVQVYRAMAKRGKCCACFPNVIAIIQETTEAVHRELATPEADILTFISKVRQEHERCETARMLARRRIASVRAA